MSFVFRVINHLANEVLVPALANSRLFQNFALRTARGINGLKNKATETITEKGEDFVSKAAENGGQAVRNSNSAVGDFFKAFHEEVMKDLSKGKK